MKTSNFEYIIEHQTVMNGKQCVPYMICEFISFETNYKLFTQNYR